MGRSSKSRGQTVYVIFAVAFEALFMELCHGERSKYTLPSYLCKICFLSNDRARPEQLDHSNYI